MCLQCTHQLSSTRRQRSLQCPLAVECTLRSRRCRLVSMRELITRVDGCYYVCTRQHHAVIIKTTAWEGMGSGAESSLQCSVT